MATSILLCCMGNICRSPSAEGVLRTMAEQAGLADALRIDSAGTHADHVGEAPDPRSQRHAARRGYAIDDLRARQVCARDFTDFDLILAMDHANLALLRQRCPPQHQHKLGLFMAYAPQAGSRVVPDPYSGGEQGFETVLDLLEAGSRGLLQSLLRESRP